MCASGNVPRCGSSFAVVYIEEADRQADGKAQNIDFVHATSHHITKVKVLSPTLALSLSRPRPRPRFLVSTGTESAGDCSIIATAVATAILVFACLFFSPQPVRLPKGSSTNNRTHSLRYQSLLTTSLLSTAAKDPSRQARTHQNHPNHPSTQASKLNSASHRSVGMALVCPDRRGLFI